jgi:hypothetical protein
VVDPEGGRWVRFVVTRVPVSPEKPHGIDYSLTLHGPDGEQLVGFDNADPVARQKSGEAQDHRHRLRTIRAYETGMRQPYPPTSGRPWTRCCAIEGGVARQRHDIVTTLKVGIASYDEMKARTMAVARGERRAAHQSR